MGGFSQQEQSSQSQSQGTNSAWSNANQQVWGGQSPYLQDLYSRAQAQVGQGSQVQGPAMNAWQQQLSGQINPGVGAVIQNASDQLGLNFNRQTMPGIQQGAIGAGALGGSRQGIAQGLAAGELARAQSGLSANLTSAALGQASDQQSRALGMSGLMGSLPWQNLEQYRTMIGGPLNQAFAQSGSQGQQSGSGSGSGSGQSMNVGAKGG